MGTKLAYCCDEMARATTFDCDLHDSEFSCPDVIIIYVDKFDEYGIIIRDGGSSLSLIFYCPWCGVKLPDSKRDLWFDTLEELGFDNPAEQDIPKKFSTSEWFKK